MIYPELYDEILEDAKYAVSKEPLKFSMEEYLDKVHAELLRMYGYGLETGKIIFHCYKKDYPAFYNNGFGAFGEIIFDVMAVLYLYCQKDWKSFETSILLARKLSLTKGNDYGNGTPIDNIYSQGNMGIISRSIDKITRQKTLLVHHVKQQVQDEPVLQSILDLLNYSIYAVMLIEKKWNTEDNIRTYYDFLITHGLEHLIEKYED